MIHKHATHENGSIWVDGRRWEFNTLSIEHHWAKIQLINKDGRAVAVHSIPVDTPLGVKIRTAGNDYRVLKQETLTERR